MSHGNGHRCCPSKSRVQLAEGLPGASADLALDMQILWKTWAAIGTRLGKRRRRKN
jgi:hypothetical protein